MIHLDPAAYAPPPGYVRSSRLKAESILTTIRTFRYWATPRASSVGGCVILTERGSKDLITQVRFERGTPDAHRGRAMSPAWLEWLMGFPEGYTAIDSSVPANAVAATIPQLPTLASDFARLFAGTVGPPPDVRLACGDVRVLAHSLVLSVRSPYLAELLAANGPPKEGRTRKRIRVEGIAPTALEALVEYMYTDALPPGARGEDVQRGAERLHLKALCRHLR
jgi:hypothetical protein